MKLLLKYLIIVSCSITVFEMTAQVEDQNTRLINTYFNLNTNNDFINTFNQPEANNMESLFILQFGDRNYININSFGKSEQKVNQIGDNNYFNYIDFYNSADMNLDIFQDGNNSSIQVYGMNSLMKDMQIKQSASDKTLIITNF